MPNSFVVLLSAENILPMERTKKVFDEYKDWLKFGAEAWIVYTSLDAKELRSELRDKLQPEDPSIIVLPTDLSGWSAYAKPMPREWLKKDRSMDLNGR